MDDVKMRLVLSIHLLLDHLFNDGREGQDLYIQRVRSHKLINSLTINRNV
jgi:hypothetical protein